MAIFKLYNNNMLYVPWKGFEIFKYLLIYIYVFYKHLIFKHLYKLIDMYVSMLRLNKHHKAQLNIYLKSRFSRQSVRNRSWSTSRSKIFTLSMTTIRKARGWFNSVTKSNKTKKDSTFILKFYRYQYAEI